MTIKISKKTFSLLGATVLAATLLLMPLVVAHAEQAGPPVLTPSETIWESCGLSNVGSCLQWFGVWAVEKLSLGLLTIGAMILWLGGTVLDKVLVYTIVEMSTRLGEGGLQTMINEIWRVARDFSNMFFIFILLYGAIVTILGRDDINVKKVVTRVVIVAILLNFSLLFTKIIIDVSNSATVAFYNRILQDIPAGSAESGGLSTAFMNRFGLTSIWDAETAKSVLNANAGGSTLKFFMLGLFGLTFMSVAAFVFCAIAALFITRYLTLLFLLILSPLAFAAMALPKDKYSGDWWKSLFNQAIFAPVCMAMLWVSLRILSVVVATPPDLGKTFAAAADSSGGNGAVSIINFVIAIGSIIAVLVIAQKTGAKGADAWLKRGKTLRKNIQSVIGRNTAGRFGNFVNDKLVKSETFNRVASKKIPSFGYGWLKTPEIRVGQIADITRKATVQNLAEQKFGGAYSRVTADEANKKYDTGIKENIRKARISNLVKEAQPLTAEERAKLSPEQIKQREEQYQELTQTLSKMSNKELESIKAKDLAPHISLLNTRQLEHVLEKSEKFNEEDKEKLRDARFKSVREAIETLDNEEKKLEEISKITDEAERKAETEALDKSIENARKAIQAITTKEIELAGNEFVSNAKFVEALSQPQADGLTKADNNNFTSDQKKKMKDDREQALINALTSSDTRKRENAVKKIAKMDGKTLAKQKIKVLTDIAVLNTLTKQKLIKMSEEIEDENTLKQIREAITSQLDVTPVPGDPGPSETIKNLADWLKSPSGKQFF